MDAKTKKLVIEAYQTSNRSLQDIARIYNVDINEVLVLTGNGHLASVDSIGDMVDRAEAGPMADLKGPQKHEAKFTLN